MVQQATEPPLSSSPHQLQRGTTLAKYRDTTQILAGGQELLGRRPQAVATEKTSPETQTKFLLFPDESHIGCKLRVGHPDMLHTCGFNASRPLVLIIHGWSVDGLLESWVWQMVAVLRSRPAAPVNVGLANWIALAHHHYATAVRNARRVGQEVAAMLQWLEDSARFSRSKVHLIGYSLGAHVAGFAGSYMGGKHKIGRITGMDAAGPLFEGMPPSDRLSPDDAEFVDVIHTFTQDHIGLSVGIKQPVGHHDFYPNGGTFQPGCHFLELYKHLAQHGLNAIPKTIKCAHERSVHLFLDSLLQEDQPSMGYQCSDMTRFSRGLCLSCRKGRCHTLGYHTRPEPRSKGRSLFLVTRDQAPFRVYHYQLKIHFIVQTEKPVEPTFTMSFLGTREEVQRVPITLGEGITSNKTYSFLTTLDVDVGELVMIRLKWETGAVWTNVWNTVQTLVPWGRTPHTSGLTLRSIHALAGETQQRMMFCPEPKGDLQLRPAQEKVFVRCEVNGKPLRRKIRRD
ncbi:hepatic triacylglycerol lipase [Ctenodactylus gundi]